MAFASEQAVDAGWLDVPAVPQDSPYHYHEQTGAPGESRWVGGWILPAAWRFGHDALLGVLLGWRGLERLKGVFHTDKGWILFNATAMDMSIKSSEYRADNRVELISTQPVDWAACEQALLATLAPAEQQQ